MTELVTYEVNDKAKGILTHFCNTNSECKDLAIDIYGSNEEPLMVAADIGIRLEIQNIRQTITDFSKDEKIQGRVFRGGKIRTVWFVTEEGFYRLIYRSRQN